MMSKTTATSAAEMHARIAQCGFHSTVTTAMIAAAQYAHALLTSARTVGELGTYARRIMTIEATTAPSVTTVAPRRLRARNSSSGAAPIAIRIAMTTSQAISHRRVSFTGTVVRLGTAPPSGVRAAPVRKRARVPTELGPHNGRIEAVRDLRTPRGRRAERRFAAEGPTLLAEAERSGARPLEIYATAAGLAGIDAGRWESAGVPVYVVPERVFARLSDLDTPTGLLAVFELPGHDPAAVLDRAGLVLLLAGVGDPGNAGTLVRSAEAFGAAGVLFGRGGADPFAPKVIRAAMGTTFRLPLAVVGPDEAVAAARAAGRPIVAADVDGEPLDAGIEPNAVIAIGNERRGVRDWLPGWDRAVRIPQRSTVESLNAAVAGSIVLYVASRCQEPCQAAEKR